MALGQYITQKQAQKLILTPDLRQSIELLALSNLELSERLQQELLENPLLEETGGEGQLNDAELLESAGESEASLISDDQMLDPEQPVSKQEEDTYSSYQLSQEGWTSSESSERKSDYIQNVLSSHETLHDHLIEQLHLSGEGKRVVVAGELIVSDIDERGFLRESLEDLIAGTRIKSEDAKRALRLIHSFDPVGCGARSVQESLRIQVQFFRPDDAVTLRILDHHFAELERLDFDAIVKAAGLTEEEILRSIQFIKTLEPYPGHAVGYRKPEYILPDVIVTEQSGDFRININDEWMPDLRINEEYRLRLEKGRAIGEERDYLQQKLHSANWFIRGIGQRRQTLFRVMKVILEFQSDFFRKGPGYLKPLTLREVSEKIEMHESTVSRITTSKYVQTRWGIFELKQFFSSSVSGSEGERHASRTIHEKLLKIVQEESPENPLSDQEITDRMNEEGIHIARRTVAKYRKLLKILPAERRKRLNMLKS
jgi:RNA polymerase sigma-54 factor